MRYLFFVVVIASLVSGCASTKISDVDSTHNEVNVVSGPSKDACSHKNESISDPKVIEKIIEDSIASYPSRCPCPYNVAKNGSRCGGRSAWSRAGGHEPLCFENEVTKEMIQQWRCSN